MNVYSNASLVGLKIKLTDNYHYKNSCGCKICSTHHWDEFIPADRTEARNIVETDILLDNFPQIKKELKERQKNMTHWE
jgi:hypothetical protein